MAHFLTYDLGTTLYKVALFDEAGKLIALERAQPPIQAEQPGWVEVRSGEFLYVLAQATWRVREAVGESIWSDLKAVSFATQANSFMLLGEGGWHTGLILWSDQRALGMAQELSALGSLPDFRTSTGMPRFSPALALAKLLWLRRHQRDDLRHARQFAFLSDFLTWELSGQWLSEASVAGLSGALDIRTLQWRNDVLELMEAPPIAMPPVQRAGYATGELESSGGHAFRLPHDARFVLGCLDQYAGAIGTGTIEPGCVCETTGTVLAAVRFSDRFESDLAGDVFQGPAFDEGKFFQMSFSSTSANLLEWYRNSLPGRPSFEELSRLAGEADDAVTIEPYRDGDPIESCFRNVGKEHSVGQVVRGIMRCVAGALKRQIQSISPTMPPVIRSAGGAARSDVWLQIKADTLGTTFEAIDCEEPTSLGAAMLACRAVTGRSMPEIARDWVRVRTTFKSSTGN